MIKQPRPTMADVRIRPLIETSLEDVEEIEALAFAHGSPYLRKSLQEIYDWSKPSHWGGSRFFCKIARAETGNEDHVLGWVSYTNFYLRRIAVHPCAWRRGIGRLLLDSIEREWIWTITAQTDEISPEFLIACGFDEVQGVSSIQGGIPGRTWMRHRPRETSA